MIGEKSLVAYGGYKTFINKLTGYHQNDNNIKYHVVCKANGQGAKRPQGAKETSETTYTYHNADCYEIKVPEFIRSAQAIYYDCKYLSKCIDIIKKEIIKNPIVYVMACRIGSFFCKYAKKIYRLGRTVVLNPDGRCEIMRETGEKPINSRLYRISVAHHKLRLRQMNTPVDHSNSLCSTGQVAA